MGSRLLIVDDSDEDAQLAARILSRNGYSIRLATSGNAALEFLQLHEVDVIVTDMDMPHMSGLQLLAEIKQRWRDRPVVVMSGLGSIDMAVQAVKCGAIDFVVKPLDLDRLREAVGTALAIGEASHNAVVPSETVERELIGESTSMVALKRMITKVAPTDCRVLIQGENGTGKELVAAALQKASPRCEQPFIRVNCGALPSTLLESELFGHEKGAFTGATSRRRGRFELADKGTLLLDEVGELSLEAQVRLLRVIQEGEFERVGGTQTVKVNVRIIGATNRDLYEMVQQGTFREDLYYRLNVVALNVPPLRDRRSDIPLLVENMVSRMPEAKRITLSEQAMTALTARSYSGNVRELENVVERLLVLLPGRTITPSDLDEVAAPATWHHEEEPVSRGPPVVYRPGVNYRDRLLQLERMLILEALEQHRQSKSAAAESLGTDKSFFYRKCRQFEID